MAAALGVGSGVPATASMGSRPIAVLLPGGICIPLPPQTEPAMMEFPVMESLARGPPPRESWRSTDMKEEPRRSEAPRDTAVLPPPMRAWDIPPPDTDDAHRTAFSVSGGELSRLLRPQPKATAPTRIRSSNPRPRPSPSPKPSCVEVDMPEGAEAGNVGGDGVKGVLAA